MLKIHFAPLQGYTESPYRLAHNLLCGGIESYYTPFIRAEHGKIRNKDLREALPEHNTGVHVVPQVIASNVSEFSFLTDKLIEIGHKEIDINMGCTFPLQTRMGRGSGILPKPEVVKEILDAAKALHEQKQIDFSIKMRLGQESPEECMTLLPMLNDTPLKHITMHPRIGKDQYKGELDMDSFDKFLGQCKIPVVFNGMIETVQDIKKIEQRYPNLAGVMIGRGLLTRPTLAVEYKNGVSLSTDEVKKKVLDVHNKVFEQYSVSIEGGEAQLVMKMHSYWEYLEPLFGHKAIKQIMKSRNLSTYRSAVNGLLR